MPDPVPEKLSSENQPLPGGFEQQVEGAHVAEQGYRRLEEQGAAAGSEISQKLDELRQQAAVGLEVERTASQAKPAVAEQRALGSQGSIKDAREVLEREAQSRKASELESLLGMAKDLGE